MKAVKSVVSTTFEDLNLYSVSDSSASFGTAPGRREQSQLPTMDPNPTLPEPEPMLLTPDIAGHVAEILARRGLKATLRELALASSAHLHAALPALYREFDFRRLKTRRKRALAEGDVLGTNRHAFVRRIRGADLMDNTALELIEKASGLVSLSMNIDDFLCRMIVGTRMEDNSGGGCSDT